MAANTNILLESGTNELEIVEFFIDETDPRTGEEYRGYYGVNVAKVLEIIRMPSVTNMPEIPHPAVLGAFNLRDKIIPLIDLASWLNKDLIDNPNHKVIVSEFNEVTNAFLVSGVTRIHRISWEQVEPPDMNVARFSNQSITGVVRFENRIILILDMEKIVGDLNPSLAMHFEEPIPEEALPQQEAYKALISDDSTSIRRMIGSLLESAGFEVTRTINGKMAWDALQDYKARSEQEGRPITDYVNVIISDIEMPVMDGHNLTKRIKEDPVLQHIPVILFSSLITERLRHKGESVGADDQVSKPDITSLTNRALSLIQGDKARAA
ncbi:MAG: two-component system, chemotaxis family, chemotaxis protein CheV [Desulfovibrionales bacterium]|nr:two-component system, chemotaxis family, chemotaxis protein CheV [Desulfovibrionales bacterium]